MRPASGQRGDAAGLFGAAHRSHHPGAGHDGQRLAELVADDVVAADRLSGVVRLLADPGGRNDGAGLRRPPRRTCRRPRTAPGSGRRTPAGAGRARAAHGVPYRQRHRVQQLQPVGVTHGDRHHAGRPGRRRCLPVRCRPRRPSPRPRADGAGAAAGSPAACGAGGAARTLRRREPQPGPCSRIRTRPEPAWGHIRAQREEVACRPHPPFLRPQSGARRARQHARGPTTDQPKSRAVLEPSRRRGTGPASAVRRRRRASTSTISVAVRREQRRRAGQQPVDVTADADVAVEQQHRRPPALDRQLVEDVVLQRRAAARVRQRHRLPRDVDAERGDTAGVAGAHHPAGAAPDVEHRLGAPVEHRPVGSVGVVQPAGDVEGAATARREATSSSAPAGSARRAYGGRGGPHQRTAAAVDDVELGASTRGEPRVRRRGGHGPGGRLRRRRRSARSSIRTRSPAARSRASWSAPVSARRHRQRPAARRPPGAGSAKPIAQNPPSSARPRQASNVPSKSGSCPASNCGVSIPTSTRRAVGRDRSERRRRAARRARRPTCGDDVPARRQPSRSASPSKTSDPAAPPARRRDRGHRVAPAPPRPARPPRSGVNGGTQPGLHPAGHRLLGDHQQRADRRCARSSRQHRAHVLHRVPGAAPGAGDLRPARARAVGDVDLRDPPARRRRPAPPSPADSRCAGRAGRAPAAPAPARPASDPGRAAACRSGAAPGGRARRWPAAACSGQARAADRAAPAERPGPPSRRATGRPVGASSGRVERGVAVAEARPASAVAASSPAWQAAP